MSPDLIGKIAEHGLLGLLLVASLFVVYRKDTELSSEKEGRRTDSEAHKTEIRELQNLRLSDAIAYSSKLLEMSKTVFDTADKLSDVADRFVQAPPQEQPRRRTNG